MEQRFTTGEDETLAFASEFAARLAPGDVVCLSGGLGVGKTVFTKGICAALGVEDMVNSPTFTIVNEYRGAGGMDVYHFDMYRLEDEDELIEIGFDDYLNADALCLIEWPENIPGFLPARRWCVTLARNAEQGDDARIITVEELC